MKTDTGDATLEIFKEGLQDTWGQIGTEVLHAHSEFGEGEDGGGEGFNEYGDPVGTMSRDMVFEICADHYIGDLSKELRELWICMSDEDRNTLMHCAFPSEVYGY